MKNPSLGRDVISSRFIAMANRAAALSGERPDALEAVEDAILHLGSSEDRALAQRILLQAQDANRMTLPGAHFSFTWFGGMSLEVHRKDGQKSAQALLSEAEIRALWLELDKQMRDLTFADMGATVPPRPSGRPTWPSVIVHTSVRCDAVSRAYMGFHCLTNMDSDDLSHFSAEGCLRHGALILVTPIPDPSMSVALLQDPSKTIPQQGWAADVKLRMEAGLAAFSVTHPHIELSIEGPWQRLSTLIEKGEMAGAVESIDRLGDIQGRSSAECYQLLREGFPGGLTLVAGSARSGNPHPGQAVTFVLADPSDFSMVQCANCSLLAGTPVEVAAQAVADRLQQLDIPVSIICLEPQAPVEWLSPDSFKLPCADGVYRTKELAFFGKTGWRFNRFDWDAGWKYGGPAFNSDDAVRRLGRMPHPLAMEIAGVEEALTQHYGADLLKLMRSQMEIPGRSCLIAADQMIQKDDSLADLAHNQEKRGLVFDDSAYVQDDALQPPFGVYCAAHWKRSSGVLMVARTSLMNRLEETSIENGFPLRFLRLPYPDIYVHFEQPITHLRSDGLKFTITGFYASEEKTEGILLEEGGFERLLVITYTYLYDGDVLRVGGLAVNIPIKKDDDRDLSEVVAQHNSALAASQLAQDDDNAADVRFTNDSLVVAAKVILYTTLKNARVVPRKDRSKLIEEMRGLKGGKREKLQARIKTAYDHIVIGPEELDDQAEDRLVKALEARGIKPHWRRGFLRTQWYGEGRTLQYQVLIAPVLVNGHLVDGSPPPRKDYTLD